jgi:hypothetical protein
MNFACAMFSSLLLLRIFKFGLWWNVCRRNITGLFWKNAIKNLGYMLGYCLWSVSEYILSGLTGLLKALIHLLAVAVLWYLTYNLLILFFFSH